MAILIVDDNPRMREMIRAILAPLDESIHECADGHRAVELYETIRPQWVLMDVAMEQMDGLEATRAIRSTDPEARIVVVTEHMEPAIRRAAADAGACGFVVKEDLSALLKVLDPEQSLQQVLEASESRYRSLFDRVPIGLYRSTPDGRLLDANAALVELLGFARREDLLETSALQFYIDLADRERWVAQLAHEGIVQDREVQLRRADGTVIWVRHSARTVLDDRGRVLCYEGAMQNVSERRRAEEQLRVSETGYRLLYDENPSMYFTVAPDERGTVLSVNRFGAEHLGYAPAELLGKSVLKVVHPGDHRAARAQLAQCVREPGRLFGWEFRKVRADGSELWVKEAARAAHGPDGLVIFIVCEDITEQRQAEEQLRRGETMAAMGALVMGVAHEVRNPLHAISATIDAIESQGQVPPAWAKDVVVLRAQVERLRHLMQDLLDFGRPGRDEFVPGALADVITEASTACGRFAASLGVSIVTRVSPGLPDLPLDRGRLVQVFTNVLENALLHSPPGADVLVEATARRDGSAVECLVLDHGPGISDQDLPRVFDPFFTRRPDGTGLGLSIVQRVVEQHGGTVEVSNRVQGGTQVRIILPAPAAGAP